MTGSTQAQTDAPPREAGPTLGVPAAAPLGATPELSVVMPCLNEAATLATCIEKARRGLAASGVLGEIIVADNGSTDGSPEIARRLGARVVAVPERGYGAALSAGIAAARGTYVLMGDADDSYDFAGLGPFVEKLRAGHDLVMGNRFLGGVRPGAMPFLNRYVGNPILSGLGRLFFRTPAGDFHCGLRAFRRAAILAMDLKTTGMEYASEMVVKATLLGLSVTEVPTTLSPDGRGRPPHLRPWRDGWRHLRFLLLYSPRWLFLYPGLALIAAGLVVGGLVLPGPLRLGAVVFDVHTLLLASAAVMLGAQSVFLAVFTKIFAIDAGLLPADPRISRWTRRFTLEAGLVLGCALALAGLAGSFWAAVRWSAHAFGQLDPTRELRIVIPSVLAMTLGCQIALASLFLSVLGLARRRETRP